MAKRTVIELIDDLSGAAIPDGEGRTVTFALNGTSYELDLSDASNAKFEEALAPFIKAGRKISSSSVRAPRNRSTSEDLTAIREWAKRAGMQVSDRGRVSAAIREAYDAAH